VSSLAATVASLLRNFSNSLLPAVKLSGHKRLWKLRGLSRVIKPIKVGGKRAKRMVSPS